MTDKIIRLVYMNNAPEITISVDKDTTYKVPSSQMYNLEHWLNTEANSIMITCENGNKVGLNKYNLQYGEIVNN